ncbi:MAG: hypothetical protein GY796_00800 [Chloroflexi bacterium]|nr:hypothetical protein [Chloroflexota bacterium]
MFLQLHSLTIQLESQNTAANQQWRILFDGWLQNERPATPDICLSLELVPHLPLLPETAVLFTDSQSRPDDMRSIAVYAAEAENVWLHFTDGALVRLPLQPELAGDIPTAAGYITPQIMEYGRFEDVTFTALAPLLRQRGYYLIHAFAAERDGRAVLVVGPSGSGKTTTGLSLLLDGWKLLSNDVVLLQAQADGVYALPTPGGVSIRAETLPLLPRLKTILSIQTPDGDGKIHLSSTALTGGDWAAAAPVTAVFFPHIESKPTNTLSTQNRAICLVKLMAESVDRWDKMTLPGHIEILQQVCEQAAVYNLHLGQDMTQLPALIMEETT